MCRLICILILVLGLPFGAWGEVVVDENFDDQAVSSPLSLYCSYGSATFSNSIYHGSSGYSVSQDHCQGDTMAIVSGIGAYMVSGVYIRYWVYMPDSYYFPGQEALFENFKVSKYAGDTTQDIEIIWKGSVAPSYCPTGIQIFWLEPGDGIGGTGTSSATLFAGANTDFAGNKYLTKGVWHKIEQYFYIPNSGPGTVRVQVDDCDVYSDNNVSVEPSISQYTGAQQVVSIRASNSPASGHGTWYFDDMYIVVGEGDLCESGSSPSTPSIRNGGFRNGGIR